MTSRFMSSDPMMDGLVSSSSMYGYCFNNPINYVDPTGYFTDKPGVEGTFDDPNDRLVDHYQDYGYSSWEDAANAMGVRQYYDNKGNWIGGNNTLVGKKLTYNNIGQVPSSTNNSKASNMTGIVLFRKNINKSRSDQYGHWWAEIDVNNDGNIDSANDESYGWWPKDRVNDISTLFGVDGELNGKTNFPGTFKKDPHQTDRADVDQILFIYKEQGDTRTRDQIIDAIRQFANSYSGKWSWPIGQNCQSFQKQMLKKLKLKAYE